MKFSLSDFSKHLRNRRDLSELEEEVEAMKGVVKDINKESNGMAEIEHSLVVLVQQRVNDPISKVRLEITFNWGHTEYTCLYRVPVH